MGSDEGRITPVGCADVTCEVCPMTFVRVKMRLDELDPGEALEVILKDGEQMRNVPKSIKAEGHRIESVTRDGDRYRLLVRKGQ